MKRKDFIKKSILGGAGLMAAPNLLAGQTSTVKNSVLVQNSQVGFNHLPKTENRKMKTILHKADSRGLANHGWLQSRHSFSFANYYNPERMNFGVLRVLNDDQVAPGKGFGKHPHDNMEIISIPLEGDLEHKDSMNNTTVIKEGDVQVMSAGTGVFHSEYNKNKDKEVKFLQIWVFPKQKNVEPRYDQITLQTEKMENNLYQILSPNPDDDGVWIHQDAWFHLGHLKAESQYEYKLKNPENGVYAFLLNGEISLEGEQLTERDAMGIWDTNRINVEVKKDSKVLLMEVPMT